MLKFNNLIIIYDSLQLDGSVIFFINVFYVKLDELYKIKFRCFKWY